MAVGLFSPIGRNHHVVEHTLPQVKHLTGIIMSAHSTGASRQIRLILAVMNKNQLQVLRDRCTHYAETPCSLVCDVNVTYKYICPAFRLCATVVL